MKINSEKLWDYIFNLPTDEKVRFKVYYDDFYTTEILWNGENFEWASGTFSSGAFFNPLYDFIPIEEEKDIERLTYENTFKDNSTLEVQEVLANKINEIIAEVKKLKELNK